MTSGVDEVASGGLQASIARVDDEARCERDYGAGRWRSDMNCSCSRWWMTAVRWAPRPLASGDGGGAMGATAAHDVGQRQCNRRWRATAARVR
ncbi:hypothetical protein E2562_031899 [Oryza meyeriana var. granulata]|uniref:Uncharacterized protein n=1 Tax=Oryza meyeriana var. granulata TaxID=110450 RepID=A0A6G1D8V5_9ORYZ|nr:hypothetical protein E2562_031899 [Oryza meyeriana var. granulata]